MYELLLYSRNTLIFYLLKKNLLKVTHSLIVELNKEAVSLKIRMFSSTPSKHEITYKTCLKPQNKRSK